VTGLRRALERVDVPEEHDARERAWPLVRAAWQERERVPRSLPVRPLVALAVLAAVAGAALSPPGRAVIEEMREAIGVADAEPTLFALPAEGRLLVTSRHAVWIVQADGSKRPLGRYREASWSPNGLFVVAARANELVALDPRGTLRWSLPRRAVRLPRWGGTRTDTRIAYLSGTNLRIVAGDGEDDRAFADSVAPVAPAWRPGRPHVLAFAAESGQVNVYEADRKELYWRSRPLGGLVSLAWSADGSRLVAVSRDRVTVFRWNRRTPLSTRRAAGAVGAALAPDGRRLAVVVARAGRSELRVDDRVLFTGPGRFTDVAWSPDGRWLLVAWADADQWVFLRSSGARDVQAVSRIATQFRSRVFPTLGGWCCPAGSSNTVSLGGNGSAAGEALPQTEPRNGRPLGYSQDRPKANAPREEEPSNTVLQGDGEPVVAWRKSTSVGLPWAGRLERGVRLPAEGRTFFTWDPVLRRAPNRDWRRVGTDRLVRMVLLILDDFAAAHPEAPRIGVGDLSRSNGGDFGPRYGLPGHVSHQNGLDVDLYYPRRDRRERPPARPSQMDQELAQDLVDRFVAAGAVKVFVGFNSGLAGPPKIVQALPHHDNHLHVRIARPR
jgi:hypothetical protein